MAQIIDFPTARIKRLVVLTPPLLGPGQKYVVAEYFRDLTRCGLSPREAAKEALESEAINAA